MSDRMTEALFDLLARIVARLATLRRQGEEAAPPRLALPAPPVPPEDCLSIPVCDSSRDAEAVRRAQDRGQYLARQERWDELAEELWAADQARAVTPGGAPIAELLAFGARADVVLAAEHALMDGNCDEEAILEGVTALELMRREFPDNPAINLIVALAHVDIGWAWRGNGWDATIPKLNRSRCMAHFERAVDLLAPFDGIELNSPLIASAHCAMLATQTSHDIRVPDRYEDLIDLDPTNPRHMRALGHHMLPRWFGNYAKLDLEARRTASRTADIWGLGAYAWVHFDAIALDEGACAHVDVDFFIDALHDIVERRPDQETVNLLAAYCAVAMRQGPGGDNQADFNRQRIVDCANWLIRDHMTEVHPLIWAHASDGFDNNARVTSVNRFAARGRDFALRVIADLFSDEIGRGYKVTFTDKGLHLDRRAKAV
ncbi:hypothetical protein [Seohaeicola zhoushanensis]|uniref:DUF4034 domain-containing protein n=1 Tax=Seohaeicola zhoushanensis TaxID=1569283 RepID=A0A8J3GWJ4_9RHOB|nr:hypothetical protein [Seohaeicola zhoushanensis]GHF44173.1 hypothetical protein GCM10017056_15140 [Seohaeicola zhoushanensis]